MAEDNKVVKGWAAWHPEEGIVPLTLRKEKDTVENIFEKWRYDMRGLYQEHGWRIRPCKIIFTDEE
jgi:hypothetical protein